MSLPAYLEIPLRLVLLVGGLVLPGSMVLRALRLPWSLAAAFASSAVVLYAAVLVFAWTGAIISFTTLAAALAGVTLVARLVPARPPITQISPSFACFTRMGGWLPLYLAFWLIIGWRLGYQPLSGPDTPFRWSWLSEQMLSFRTLDFYPPRTSDDFVRYFWAESIPPGIAGLHAWAYACGGNTLAWWTSPVSALELFSVHELAWRLGNRWGGEKVARRSVLFVAACPLLTWSATLGQETGLMALAAVGIVWALSHAREVDGDRWTALAAIFSIAAASCREYGPLFPLATLAASAWLGAPRRQLWLLTAIALPLAAAWPVRVWALTGNPVFSLNVAGMFPTNPVFTMWNDTLRGPAAESLARFSSWLHLGRYFLLWALPSLLGLVALVVLLAQWLREARLVAVFVALTVGLWLISVGYTAGGLFYSLRVLGPAFALLSVTASYGLAHVLKTTRADQVAALFLAGMLLESLPKTLVLPENPYRVAPKDWTQALKQLPVAASEWDRALLDMVRPLPDRRRVVSDYVGAPKLFASIGTEVAPLWSPQVSPLFDDKLKPEEIAQRWRRSGLRYLVLLKSGPTAGFVQTRALWRAPHFSVKTVAETPNFVLLEATALQSVAK